MELERQSKAKRDYIAPMSGMHLRDDGRTFEISNRETGERMEFGTSSLFHRQTASTLGIPAKYYDTMQAQKPGLLAENVNAWFSDRDQPFMVRTMDYGNGYTARALLSERYRRIDNLEIASAVLPLFAGNDKFDMASTEVTDSRLYLKVVNKRLEMEVVPGDIVQAGVVISNSEVGLGAVSVKRSLTASASGRPMWEGLRRPSRSLLTSILMRLWRLRTGHLSSALRTQLWRLSRRAGSRRLLTS